MAMMRPCWRWKQLFRHSLWQLQFPQILYRLTKQLLVSTSEPLRQSTKHWPGLTGPDVNWQRHKRQSNNALQRGTRLRKQRERRAAAQATAEVDSLKAALEYALKHTKRKLNQGSKGGAKAAARYKLVGSTE